MRDALAVCAGLLTLACVVPYIRDVRSGATVPHRTTWFVFTALAATASVAQLVEGSIAGAVLAAGAAVGFAVVFVLSLRCGIGGRQRADRAAVTIAIAGVAISCIVRNGFVAVLAVIAAEWAAGVLTIAKAFEDPGSETQSTWVIDGCAGLVAIAATPFAADASAVVYPVHHAALNFAVVAAQRAGARRATLTVERSGVG